MTKELTLKGLDEGYMGSERPEGALIHSDRGSQYCSREYWRLAKDIPWGSSAQLRTHRRQLFGVLWSVVLAVPVLFHNGLSIFTILSSKPAARLM